VLKLYMFLAALVNSKDALSRGMDCVCVCVGGGGGKKLQTIIKSLLHQRPNKEKYMRSIQ
jgi:hypothetical protein